MLKSLKKIAIITTQQNYKWVSMQEVLPSIEKCWKMTADECQIEYLLINVDVEPFRNYARQILECDAIIIIAFNETIARFMRETRQTLGLSAPFILHLYGHASLGLWPQYRFKVLQMMTEGDAFIGTCPGDIHCMQLTSDNARVYDIPYPYFPIKKLSDNQFQDSERVFAYVGRISDQKNIDSLIRSYALLIEKIKDAPLLIIYGKEDHLGSPNMGIASTDCLSNLKSQILNLGLEKNIFFKGFLSRETIYSELGSNHIFVSASTHSDENFGMALLRSLAIGANAVVTHWGGHQVFAKHLEGKVWSVPVIFSNSRPLPNENAFAEAMEQALFKNKNIPTTNALPEYYLPQNIIEQFKIVLQNVHSNSSPLVSTEVAKSMYKQQAYYENLGDMQRVFDSYEDPCAQLFLKAYSRSSEG
jgi:glycosyltransferase involved in cell wall biosynthesis